MPSGDAAGGVFSGLNHLLSYIFHRHHQFPLMFLKKEKKKIRKKKMHIGTYNIFEVSYSSQNRYSKKELKKKKKKRTQP